MKHPMRKVFGASIAAACGGGEGETPTAPIPTEPAGVESAAKSGFNAALAGDRTVPADAGRAAANHWASYRRRGASDEVAADALVAVNGVIAGLDGASAVNATGRQLARAFNAISAPTARIHAVYKPPVPATPLDLDYLGRALIADACVADLVLASADLTRLTARWAPFRSSVVAIGGRWAGDRHRRHFGACRRRHRQGMPPHSKLPPALKPTRWTRSKDHLPTVHATMPAEPL
jgi:hypothetical protein